MPSTHSKPVIVVPVYQERLGLHEKQSLFRLAEILGAFPIQFVAPKTLHRQTFLKIVPEAGFEYFPEHYFTGTRSYNKLLLSQEFFERFSSYTHMLIAQTDSYVFRDELIRWCDSGYSYIGAPWFNGFSVQPQTNQFLGVGNGGFSLRNIEHSLKVLSNCPIVSRKSAFRNARENKLRLHAACRAALRSRSYRRQDINWTKNEDVFWGVECAQRYPWYRVPTCEEAARFSFEVNPSGLYQLTGSVLPFGCHAWQKYDPEFWATHIPAVKNN